MQRHSPARASAAVLGGTPDRRLYRGRDLSRAMTIEDLRAMTHRFLPRFALEYLEGGSEDEATLDRNRDALARYLLVPQALVDVSQRDLSTQLFGRPLRVPIVIAPTGLNGLFRAGADRMLAEAAAQAGLPFTQSTMSNDPMADVARVENLRHWWQLYVFGSARVFDRLVDEAGQAGCEVLVVTVDAQTYGNQEWSRRNFTRPGRMTIRSMIDAGLHPAWVAATLLRQGLPRFANIIDFVPEENRSFFDSAHWVRSQMRRDLDWDLVRHIRKRWPRKLLVKGLLRVEDVRRAADAGADGVVLSNHGGRQLDWTLSGLDCLPQARAAVGAGFTILVDGGIRRGSDIVKALALGADAVQIGRAALYGVAAGGSPGASRAIQILREEMDRAMALLGVTSVRGLTSQQLQRLPLTCPDCESESRTRQ